jgi:hypothetical protein
MSSTLHFIIINNCTYDDFWDREKRVWMTDRQVGPNEHLSEMVLWNMIYNSETLILLGLTGYLHLLDTWVCPVPRSTFCGLYIVYKRE